MATSSLLLPHRYPFLLVERVIPGVAVMGISSGALTRGRHPPALPNALALEIMAQASLVLSLPEDAARESESASEPGLLAGVDDVEFSEELCRQPLAPGDRVHARIEVLGSFGRLKKVRGTLDRDGVRMAEAILLLAGG